MGITKKITSLLAETISSPLKPSYIINQTNKQFVLRPGGDYSGVDLSGLDLKGFNLKDTNLKGASLVGTNLAGANLEHSNLRGADLSGTILSGAHLEGATIDRESIRNAIFEVAPSGISFDSFDTLNNGESK